MFAARLAPVDGDEVVEPSAGDSHVVGSWSAFDRFDVADTAINARSSPRSLAYASRSSGDQCQAPESQASASGTR